MTPPVVILGYCGSLLCWWGERSVEIAQTPQSFSRRGPYLHAVISSHQELVAADAAVQSGLLLRLVQPAAGQNQGQHKVMDPSSPLGSLPPRNNEPCG